MYGEMSHKCPRSLCNAASGLAFLFALAVYWLTADTSVSYWDCPEYVTCASRLEVGHPPGNPVWMLAMRFATIPFPESLHAYVINLCSGFFMALAVFFLARIIFMLLLPLSARLLKRRGNEWIGMTAAAGSLCGALCFAFCDSAWFSAVEAEVYAMSAFLTALSVWLMLVWARTDDEGKRLRLLILIAYVTGLSLGVHQLNLLVIPVLALIFVFARHPQGRQTFRAWIAILLSFVIVGAILAAVMPGVVAGAAATELFAVNSLGLPYFYGATAFMGLLFLAVLALRLIADRRGLTIISTSLWMLFFIILGYSSFALILIRGCASPPMNEAAPTDIFALQRYIGRDQYGSKPLLYGATLFSEPMLQESWKPGASIPDYTRYALEKGKPRLVASLPEARIVNRSGFMTAEDSAHNLRALKSGRYSYLLSDYAFRRETTPELDMWFPRITGKASDIDDYAPWAGLSRSSMDHIEVSAALDTLGHPVGKMDASGNRHKEVSVRPTYLQNLRMLLSYQVYYMYFRYILWNFAGRQNDIPSTGEIDHGNFITGFTPLDNAMLGDQSLMPDYASHDNPGRNVYYCIPFILGIIGIVVMARCGRLGRRELAVVTMFFLMTGLAIVVYLNQSPGEPRERDYSFLGSIMAFTVWIAVGAGWGAAKILNLTKYRAVGCAILAVAAFGVPSLMLAENLDDHNRNGRFETSAFAENILTDQPDGIIFTQGDNFTFPLWYAQETEGIGKGNCVIDVSYLATPEYVVNLMRQGEEGVAFTATPADVAYGAYAFTRIPSVGDTTAVPLIEALRELYSQREGTPRFTHSRVTIPGMSQSDTLTIDLRKFASGSLMPFRKLMLLDIIATNLEAENPRPVYFLSSLSTSFYSAVKEATRPTAFAEVYNPQMNGREYMELLSASVDRLRKAHACNPELPDYIEPVVADQHRRQRGALTRMARVMLDSGRYEESRGALLLGEDAHPFSRIPGASFTVADSTFHEGIEFARLLIELSRQTGSRADAQHAASLLEDMKKTAGEWRRYYSSLPADRRPTVSNESRRLILTIPVIDSLLNIINTSPINQ